MGRTEWFAKILSVSSFSYFLRDFPPAKEYGNCLFCLGEHTAIHRVHIYLTNDALIVATWLRHQQYHQDSYTF
jgi:hypothetical protein